MMATSLKILLHDGYISQDTSTYMMMLHLSRYSYMMATSLKILLHDGYISQDTPT